jgi:hypothetical protein
LIKLKKEELLYIIEELNLNASKKTITDLFNKIKNKSWFNEQILKTLNKEELSIFKKVRLYYMQRHENKWAQEILSLYGTNDENLLKKEAITALNKKYHFNTQSTLSNFSNMNVNISQKLTGQMRCFSFELEYDPNIFSNKRLKKEIEKGNPELALNLYIRSIIHRYKRIKKVKDYSNIGLGFRDKQLLNWYVNSYINIINRFFKKYNVFNNFTKKMITNEIIDINKQFNIDLRNDAVNYYFYKVFEKELNTLFSKLKKEGRKDVC